MERRVLLALLLSAIVLYVFNAYFTPPEPPPGAKPAQQAKTAAPASAPAASTPSPAAADAVAAASPPAATPEPQSVTGEPSERDIVIDTTTVQAVVSNRGGRLIHWRLKEYRDDEGKPVDLVSSGVPGQPAPFSLRVDDPQITSRLNAAVYRVSGDDHGHVDATRKPGTVAFDYQDSAGLHAHKEFTFDTRMYQLTFSTRVTTGDRTLNPSVEMGAGLGDLAYTATGGFFNRSYDIPPEAIYEQGGKVQRVTQSKVTAQPDYGGTFRFAGVDDHYFIAIAIDPGQARLDYKPVTAPGLGNPTPRQLLAHTIHFQNPPQRARFFIGPKQFDVLRAVDAELVRAINFGMFAWLVIPLLSTLKWLNIYIGNYGWSIVVLTLLINIVILPLRHKSVVSMRKMQVIQPQIKAIQDRYADLKMTDPAKQKMNTEVMNLYRENGVNPASGCVPMLLTFPILFALYALLSQAIELRGADWMFWIHDLSQKDPYYVTPIIVGITMWWQQKMTPTTVDPAQQKMMMAMPLIFTATFFTLPSGLAIYYLANNVFAVGQQYFTNWMIGPPPVPRPPAERRVKNAGSGRTAAAEKRP